MEQPAVLWESGDMIVCVKPAGVLSQAGRAGETSMVTLLSDRTGGEIHPVHRLDREVGGVMVYAKTGPAAAALGRQLQQGRMEKEYLAVLRGVPPETEGQLTDLLYHDRTRNKTYVVARRRKGVREAGLVYRVLQSAAGRTLVQVRLLTGRTHQIRAQFASRGLPLAGDGRYGGGGGGLALWSVALTLDTPTRRRFTCLPERLGPFSDLKAPEPLEAEKFTEPGRWSANPT